LLKDADEDIPTQEPEKSSGDEVKIKINDAIEDLKPSPSS
jgi:hypothetical protein